jgi:hypothetical protein
MRILAGNAQPNNGPRLTPAPARFHTIVGVPATIALQYATGKPVQSPKTREWSMMYSLTTGEKAYFPMEVGKEIDSLTLAPGQPFTICHNGGGNWDVDRAPQAPYAPARPLPAQPPPSRPPDPPLPPAASLHSSASHGYKPPQAPPPQMMNGAGEDLPAILGRCYMDAIAVTVAACEAARANGLHFAPSHEGLQACAATLFIAETRRQ